MVKLFGKKYPVRKLLLFAIEGSFLFLSFIAVAILRYGPGFLLAPGPFFWGRVGLVVFVCLLSLYYFDLYTFRSRINYLEMTSRLAQALGTACVLLGFLFFAFPALLPGKGIFLAGLVVFIALSSLWRYAYCWILRKGIWAIPVLIVGQGRFPFDIIREIATNHDCGYKIVGMVSDGNLDADSLSISTDLPFFGSFSGLLEKVKTAGAEELIVAMDQRRGSLPVEELLRCKMEGIPVHEGETFYEEVTGRILVDKINPSWLIFHEGFQKRPLMLFLKRVVGMSTSAVGLILSLPFTLLIAILIKLESEGPVFYRQERVGKDGRIFEVIKFRSMRQDAEQDGAQWARSDDERVTRVGRVIRRLRIDEIPQMWNVLKGDMSFVGPRPERPLFVEKLREKIRYYDQRHTVQPGITGWAQINYPYGSSVKDAKCKLEYDLYYIKHMSVVLDLYIILKTVKTILFREGAR